MMINDRDDERSAARKVDQGTKAGKQKIKNL